MTNGSEPHLHYWITDQLFAHQSVIFAQVSTNHYSCQSPNWFHSSSFDLCHRNVFHYKKDLDLPSCSRNQYVLFSLLEKQKPHSSPTDVLFVWIMVTIDHFWKAFIDQSEYLGRLALLQFRLADSLLCLFMSGFVVIVLMDTFAFELGNLVMWAVHILEW